MFEIIKSGTDVNFVGKRNIYIALSILCILATGVLFFTKGLNYGIDFTGGAEVHLKAPVGWDISQVRSVLEKNKIEEPRVQRIGDGTTGEYLIRIRSTESELQQIATKVKASSPEFEIIGSSIVGPAAGSTLRKSGFLSMFYALLVILLYVAIRFDARYAPGAVLALFHDTVITIGVLILTQKQFDLTILAAILALIGYSNNDTIIVFDRVRETVAMHPELPIEGAVNRAINETLGRTILTSFMTFLTALSLYIFGGSVIENFAFTFMIGIVVGTYSSIFVASSLLIYLSNYKKNHAKAQGFKRAATS